MKPKMQEIVAYKIGINNGKLVLITLVIPQNATTNIYRNNCVNRETASHRCSLAYVSAIEGDTATSLTNLHEKLVYKVGEMVYAPSFDPDLESTNTTGIHFYLSPTTALLKHGMVPGKYVDYHDNGVIRVRYHTQGNQPIGLLECFGENGQILSQVNYSKPGVISGAAKFWHENGQLEKEINYINGKECGLLSMWFANGKQKELSEWNNGELHGSAKTWYPTGTQRSCIEYKDGILHGFCKSWYENGVIAFEGEYYYGTPCGISKSYSRDGTLINSVDYRVGFLEKQLASQTIAM